MLFYLIPAVLALTVLLLAAAAWFARSREPRRLEGCLLRAQDLQRAGRTQEAIALLEQALSRLELKSPDFCEVCFTIGRLCYERKDYAKAGEWFDKTFARAFELGDFAYTDEFLKVFETYLMIGRRTQAIGLYRRLLAMRGTSPDFGKIKKAAPLLGLAWDEAEQGAAPAAGPPEAETGRPE